MNIYSNKQRWKIILLVLALVFVGISLYVSNRIVSKVHDREKERAKQWAGAIKKKVELVRLTNQTFIQLREKEREKVALWIDASKEIAQPTSLDMNSDISFPLQIINQNKNIPVVLLDNEKQVSASVNIPFDTSHIRALHPKATKKELNRFFDDSLIALSEKWSKVNPPFTIEVYEGLFMTYYYGDSKEIIRLEHNKDSLLASFNDDLINNEGLVPVLLFDVKNDSIIGSNLPAEEIAPNKLDATKNSLQSKNDPLPILFGENQEMLLYFDSSSELKQLTYFPYIQFFIIGLFIFIAYLIFSTFRKAEQNKVWAGMAKETAHQLGTPLSSLMAWTELLDNDEKNKEITIEMRKDITRLDKVTDRFSKIGSSAKLGDDDLEQTTKSIIEYLRPRISKKVELTISCGELPLVAHNASLLEWVIENIIKNAVDAMEAQGKIDVKLHSDYAYAYIDISDNGKGIDKKNINKIFKPGFSTKKRGWGLGLTLVKRIVNEYHKGKVFVLHSELNKGTTFRISLPYKP
jgi:two-component system, sporulation sensor kinase D